MRPDRERYVAFGTPGWRRRFYHVRWIERRERRRRARRIAAIAVLLGLLLYFGAALVMVRLP